MNPSVYADVFFNIGMTNNNQQQADVWTHPSADGGLEETFTLLPPVAITWRSLSVVSFDAYRRGFMTLYN